MLRALPFLLLALAGCGRPDDGSPCRSRSALTTDQMMLAVSEDVPTFGGLVAVEGAWLVWLTDLRQSSTAAEKIPARLQNFEQPTAPMRFRQGKFTWTQLMIWRNAINNSASMSPYNTALGIDPNTNKVRFGVKSLQFEPGVRQEAEKLGIPRDALEVESFEVVVGCGP